MQSTRMVPKRSATAPARGWPMPHRRFWIAKASAKTSRPHPCALDIGVRKKPKEERGPKVKMAIRQPHTRTTAGVRQVVSVFASMGGFPGRVVAEVYIRKMGAARFPHPIGGATYRQGRGCPNESW